MHQNNHLKIIVIVICEYKHKKSHTHTLLKIKKLLKSIIVYGSIKTTKKVTH